MVRLCDCVLSNYNYQASLETVTTSPHCQLATNTRDIKIPTLRSKGRYFIWNTGQCQGGRKIENVMEYEMMSGEIREKEREQYVKYLLLSVLCLCMREVTPASVTSGQLDTLGAGSFQTN